MKNIEAMDIEGFKVTIQYLGRKYGGSQGYGISVFKDGWQARTTSLSRHVRKTIYALIETYPNGV